MGKTSLWTPRTMSKLEKLLENARWGNAEGVKKYMTEQNINAPVINENNTRAIHEAAYKGQYDTILALLEGKADITLKDKDGKTPEVRAHEHNKETHETFLRA